MCMPEVGQQIRPAGLHLGAHRQGTDAGACALLVSGGELLLPSAQRLAELAARVRPPAMVTLRSLLAGARPSVSTAGSGGGPSLRLSGRLPSPTPVGERRRAS